VPGADAALLEVWAVTVTPTDGIDVGPAATASVTIGNSPPTAPVLSLSPTDPSEGTDLTLNFDVPSTDPDGDALTTTIRWYQDDSYFATLDDLLVVPGRYVDNDEVFRAVVSTTDGFHDAVVAEASVYVTWSCTNLPPEALSYDTFTDAVAYHGLAFDDDGNLIGWDGRSGLFKSEYGGSASLWVPSTNYIQQIDRLADGDFVYGDYTAGRLVRLSATGATSTLATGIGSPYGVVVGPDGDVWVAASNVYRVDKDTGAVTTVLSAPSIYAHSLAFNLDSTVLYIGTIGSSGTIWQLALDSDLNAVGSPTEYVTGVGAGYHDGLEIDECGNLYAADYTTRGFYRVDTAGNVTSMVPADSSGYGHGAKWGSGIGGWRDDAIYQPQPYNGNTVREVVIGFHSGDTVRTWNGVPTTL
jgi:sugar lactone lactonase YvrE